MKKFLMAGAVACAALFAASGASAAVAVNFNNCGTAGVFDAPFTYISCAGGYDKNVLNNSKNGVDTQKAALESLGFDTADFDFNSFFKINSLNGADVTSPPAPLMKGITIFGIHFGNSSVLGNATAFYKFDAGAGTTTDPPGPVPENTSVAIIAPSAHASAAHRSAVSRRTASSSAPTPITATSRPSGIGPHIAACPIVPAKP